MVIVASGMARGRVRLATTTSHIPENCRTLHFFFLFHVENRLGIFHFAYGNQLREKATKSLVVAHRGNENL